MLGNDSFIFFYAQYLPQGNECAFLLPLAYPYLVQNFYVQDPRQKNHMIHYFLGTGTIDIAFLARLFKMHLNFRKYSIFDRRPALLPRKPRILGIASAELVA